MSDSQSIATRRALILTCGLVATCLLGFVAGTNFPTAPSLTHQNSQDGSNGEIDVRQKRRPLIGITSLTDDPYVRAIRKFGGVPIVLPNSDGNIERVGEYLELLDGLLLPGGADIPPAEYGEEAHETVNELSQSRYQFERAICRAWIEQTDKPMLGICLGSQWINVASGGTLIQDIPTEYETNHRGVSHPVKLYDETRLRGILGEDQLQVNSSHHQCVGELGQNLRVAARSPDGVIEATESTDPERFLIGVQWHPERLYSEDAKHGKLFSAFVKAAVEVSEHRQLSEQVSH